jgi:hypothetical protein
MPASAFLGIVAVVLATVPEMAIKELIHVAR